MEGSRPLSIDEWRELKLHFSGTYAVRNRCLFELCLAFGMRISELLSLQVRDVWIEGEPATAITLSSRRTKTKRSRFIPVSRKARETIRALIEDRIERDATVSPDEPLFKSRKHGPLSRYQAHRILKDAVKKAGLSGRISTHSMRKTAGTELMRKNVPLPVIQEILGHSSLDMTRRYYAQRNVM